MTSPLEPKLTAVIERVLDYEIDPAKLPYLEISDTAFTSMRALFKGETEVEDKGDETCEGLSLSCAKVIEMLLDKDRTIVRDLLVDAKKYKAGFDEVEHSSDDEEIIEQPHDEIVAAYILGTMIDCDFIKIQKRKLEEPTD